ncbi:ATP-dependent RNA helicase [Auritidibacter ignavus]|uniref:ATP-dependent RNA helicase n=1 Tax=Auritidibacter ignavus TaxID=678932 RepID=UPI000F03043C|nr:ATP-dependent helicase C-terminal domain-containing protein [Auritidibacter ignavus]NIH72757.1 ATP-dependent helicase HrpB [Auritidibacter ignavus]RMX23828.1 DEAD/DEAH box helicase [Auritidibacter ignavus]
MTSSSLSFHDALPQIGHGLPAASLVEELLGLPHRLRAVVESPPGTGKTTIIPPLLAARAEHREPGLKVVVTQPRRVAARAAARRLAQLTRTIVGDHIGYTVRGDAKVSAQTQIEFVTVGVLLRRLLRDPDLDDVSAVVIDEIHERSVETDLTAAFIRDLLPRRDDLELVAMSATAQSQQWVNYFDAALFTAHTEIYALTEEFSKPPAALDDRGVTPAFLAHVAKTTAQTSARTEGDVLVFLPGVAEIRAVQRQLPEALVLTGSSTVEEQDQVLSRASHQRIILATNVAESSLTVPGVRAVVDSGLERTQRLDTMRAMTGLVTVGASKASMRQRAGRAARLGPGLVVRCVTEREYAARPSDITPEILTSDLTSAVLFLACWGPTRLPTCPPQRAYRAAVEVLRALEAIEPPDKDSGAWPVVTDLGRRLASVPTEPRLARALLDGSELLDPATAATAVALLDSDQRAPGVNVRARELPREAHRFLGLTGAPPSGIAPAEKPREQDLATVAALAYPDRIARRRERDSREFLLVSGTAAELPRDSRLPQTDWLVCTEVGLLRGKPIIRAAVPVDQDTVELLLPVTQERVAEWSGQKVTVREVSRICAIILHQTPVAATSDDTLQATARAIRVQGLEALNPSQQFWQYWDRLRFAHHHLPDWPDPRSFTPEQWAPFAQDLLSGLKTLVGWDKDAELQTRVPERLTVPSGSSYRVDYSQDPPVLAVKLQEMFGAVETPTIADVPVSIHLLSPAGRPLAITQDLPFFWSEVYPQVRAENRGRYAKHPWPEDPTTATATRLTNKRLHR